MGVQLNIKSAEARELAEKVAKLSGETITEAVTTALRKRLREMELGLAVSDDKVREREAEFYYLIDGSRSEWKGAMLSIDHGDLLYDEYGLPR